MANSLRNKIKHFCYKGYLSERERDRLLNALDDADRINSELNRVKMELEQTRWIPITEKPPEFHQDILLSLRSLDVTDGFRSGTEPYFYCHGEYIEPQNVLAWMPLPEPYKAESEDKE